ncbi:MAG: phosphoadenylyl-sulfate reductase [Vicingaceae bacterium]|nr:phosphoadenylyl-sulfate reductase [Vicingaceae bacterium]
MSIEYIKRVFNQASLIELNQKYRALTPEQRVNELYKDFNEAEIMLTSSFAGTSALLLKLFSDIHPSQEVLFIDTGYHFKDTIIYKDYLTQLYNLKVTSVGTEKWKHDFTTNDQTWKKDPDLCCSINKVEPLEALKENYTVWASGLMAWQSDHRSTLDIFEERGGILKFYPLLDVSREDRDNYIREHHLPFHPLISKGYFSIGCEHCTVPGKDRSGRWNNNPKTECGLHL